MYYSKKTNFIQKPLENIGKIIYNGLNNKKYGKIYN
jgi:hypothetical protein